MMHRDGIIGPPDTFFIDRNGVMRRKFVGGVDWTAPDITEFLGKM